MTPTPTPRTDAVSWDEKFDGLESLGAAYQKMRELARQLERELAECLDALGAADEALAATYWTSDDGANMRDSEPDESGASEFVVTRWKLVRETIKTGGVK